MEVNIAFAFSVFLAGVLTFLAPCTLPLLPAYLAFMSGVSPDDFIQGDKRLSMRIRMFKNALSFVFGFSVVFILTGILVGFIGMYVGEVRTIFSYIGGIFIIFFGLLMLGFASRFNFFKAFQVPIPHVLKPGNPLSSLVMGATFALGWTPCVGPLLASVLLLAGTTGSVLQGGFLLCIFSLGLAIPFLLTALAYAHASVYIKNIEPFLSVTSKVGGVILIGIGFLLLTGNFGLLIEYGYRIFNILGLSSLFDNF